MRIHPLVAVTTITAFTLLTGCQRVRGPIGPNEHFQGLVNGSDQHPIVRTVCPGPAAPGRLGPVAAGQTLSVLRVSDGGGNTGVFSSIRAWVDPSAPAPPGGPPSLTFTIYGTDQPIPTDLSVPCDGPGRVVFSSCPYLAPCAAGLLPDSVEVQFVNGAT